MIDSKIVVQHTIVYIAAVSTIMSQIMKDNKKDECPVVLSMIHWGGSSTPVTYSTGPYQ